MCVRTMSQTDSLRLMMTAMKRRPDCLNIAAESLNRMFEKVLSDLVAQVNILFVFFQIVKIRLISL